MVGRCGGRGAAASKSRWITTSPPRHRRARSRSRSSSASPSANIGSRILCTFAGSKLGCGRDGSASDRAADRHQQAKLAEGLEWAAPGGTGSQGRGRAASRASRPAPQNGTRVWQRRSCPRSTETTWMPRTILAVATRIMPAAAAAVMSRPSGRVIARSSARARRVDIEREFAAEAHEISESDITPLTAARGRAMKSLRIPRSDELDYWRVPAWSMSTSDLDTACDRLGVDSAKREELHTAVIAEARRYLRRTKQEEATPPLSRQKALLAKVEDAAGRLMREVEKLAPC